jgi:hypothetical protein
VTSLSPSLDCFSGKKVTVPENVIFDQDANGGTGLTCEQECKFKDEQAKMEKFYAQIGIQFKVTYTKGRSSIRWVATWLTCPVRLYTS